MMMFPQAIVTNREPDEGATARRLESIIHARFRATDPRVLEPLFGPLWYLIYHRDCAGLYTNLMFTLREKRFCQWKTEHSEFCSETFQVAEQCFVHVTFSVTRLITSRSGWEEAVEKEIAAANQPRKKKRTPK